jgi:hypothetical protein
MAEPTWVALEELKNDQVLDGQLTSRDDEALQRVLRIPCCRGLADCLDLFFGDY